MHTQNRVSQDLPVFDAQLFVPATKLVPATGLASLITNGLGISYVPVPTAATTQFFAGIDTILRTGMFASLAQQTTQEQFGGSAGPTPSSSANNGPLGTAGFPPITGANLPTITGGIRGVIAKGFQVNWVDVLLALGTAATISQVNVTLGRYLLTAGSAPTTTIDMNVNLGVLGAIANNIQRYRATNPTPAMLTTDGSAVSLNITPTTTGTGPAQLYGAILGVSYNYN